MFVFLGLGEQTRELDLFVYVKITVTYFPSLGDDSQKRNMPGLWSVHDNPSSRLCRIPLPPLPHLGPNARDVGVYSSGALVSTPSLLRNTSANICFVVCVSMVGIS